MLEARSINRYINSSPRKMRLVIDLIRGKGVDEALTTLSAMDGDLGRIVELRFFAGMSIDETAAVLGVSTPTVARRWRVARMWLWNELNAAES